jgi:uncharacterized protein YndB with AHSA1/START domain
MKLKSSALLVSVAVVSGAAAPARAEVAAIGAGGFTVNHSIQSEAPPDAVYEAIVEHIAAWWDGAHSWSGDAANLHFDARVGGCLCEKLPGGGVEHLRIIYLAPGREIRMQGALGPLQQMGLQGTMTWKFSPSDAGSEVDWQYTVHGFLEGGFEGIAPAVDGVIGDQLARLGAWLESR